MKVCHIVPGYYPLNAGPYEYTRKLASMGIDVHVIAFGRQSEARNELVDGVQVRRVPLRTRGHFSPQTTYKFVSAVLKWLAGRRYDLIHTYAFRGCALLPILGHGLASRWLLDIRTGNVSSGHLRSNLANRVTSLESRAFDACIALDQQVGDRVLGQGRFFYVVPLGADSEKFKPRRNQILRKQLGISENHLVVLFTGKLKPQRLLERVLQGFSQAIQRCPDLTLLIVGDGSMLGALRSLAERLRIASKVHFAGYIPYACIHDYMAVGDIGLAYVPMTPQYDPQPPLKTVEFLACGLPTIATCTKGNALFIQDGENGLLVNDDPRSLADGILRLARDSALREKLARSARPSVAEYDWKWIVKERLLPVYEQLLEDVD